MESPRYTTFRPLHGCCSAANAEKHPTTEQKTTTSENLNILFAFICIFLSFYRILYHNINSPIPAEHPYFYIALSVGTGPAGCSLKRSSGRERIPLKGDNCKFDMEMKLQLWQSDETRDPRVEEVRPGISLGAYRRIPAYCRCFGRNIAIRAVCRRFWKNCFRQVGGKRSTDRFWGGYTEILL